MDSIIIFTAKYVIGLVVLVVAYVWLRLPKRTKLEMAATMFLAGVFALLVSRLLSHFYFDPRAFVRSGVRPLIAHAADNGFPSDHALFAMTLTTVLYFYSKKWAVGAYLLTVAVSFSRVLAHVHSPIDIAGAWLIGAASAVLAVYIIRHTPWFSPIADNH